MIEWCFDSLGPLVPSLVLVQNRPPGGNGSDGRGKRWKGQDGFQINQGHDIQIRLFQAGNILYQKYS